MPDEVHRPDRLERALALLADEVRERIDRHPLGHLVAGRGEHLDLRLLLPTALRDGQLAKDGRQLSAAIDAALQSLLAHSAVLQAGRVLCLRCGTARCEHAVPSDSRQIFAGWGTTGLPRFVDFGQWLLARRDPRLDLLYREPPQMVAVEVSEAELAGDLLPAFAKAEAGYRIHGQVAAGWFQSPDPSGPPGARMPLAVTFQILSTQTPGERRRFGVNVLGLGPGGEPLANLYDRLGEIPWHDAVRWTQSVLASIEGKKKIPKEVLDQRLAGLVGALARRLDKAVRGKERRTAHGELRHKDRERPTGMALPDLAHATPENLLFDTRRETLVVVGDKGRAHVFSLTGKLVTSVRYSPAAIERRRGNGTWRPATPEEVAQVRSRVEAGAILTP